LRIGFCRKSKKKNNYEKKKLLEEIWELEEVANTGMGLEKSSGTSRGNRRKNRDLLLMRKRPMALTSRRIGKKFCGRKSWEGKERMSNGECDSIRRW